MKKLEKLRKLPKCDTNTQGEQCYWKNGANKFARGWVATNLQCVKKKKKVFVKQNKTRYAYEFTIYGMEEPGIRALSGYN